MPRFSPSEEDCIKELKALEEFEKNELKIVGSNTTVDLSVWINDKIETILAQKREEIEGMKKNYVSDDYDENYLGYDEGLSDAQSVLTLKINEK